MEFDAEIDAELNNLTDISLEEIESYESDENLDITEDVPAIDYDPSHVDWMKLFLNRTSEQTKNIETSLSGAEIVLKEIDKNVNECHSRALSVLEEKDFISQDAEDSAFHGSITKETIIISEIEQEKSNQSAQNKNMQVSESNMLIDDHIEVDSLKLETDKRILEFEALCENEILHRLDDIETKRLASEKRLQELEDAERKILFDLDQQKLFYENERKTNAACLIQSLFRRFLARKEYGLIIDERLRELKQQRVENRLRLIEEKRRKETFESEQLKDVFQTEIDDDTEEPSATEPESDSDDSSSKPDKMENALSDQSTTTNTIQQFKPTSKNSSHVESSSTESKDFDSESEVIEESPQIVADVSVPKQRTSMSRNELTSSTDEISTDSDAHNQAPFHKLESNNSRNQKIISPENSKENSLLAQVDKTDTPTNHEKKSDLITKSQSVERNTLSKSLEMKHSTAEQGLDTRTSYTIEETVLQTNSVYPDSVSFLDTHKNPEFSSEAATITKLKRDLSVLEQSAMLDDHKNNEEVNRDRFTSKPQQNLTPKSGESLLQMIDSDLTQLNASVILDEKVKNNEEAGVEAISFDSFPKEKGNTLLTPGVEVIPQGSIHEIETHDERESTHHSSSQICVNNQSTSSPESCVSDNTDKHKRESVFGFETSCNTLITELKTRKPLCPMPKSNRSSCCNSPSKDIEVLPSNKFENNTTDCLTSGRASILSSTQLSSDFQADAETTALKNFDADENADKERNTEFSQVFLPSDAETDSNPAVDNTDLISEHFLPANRSHSPAVSPRATRTNTPRKDKASISPNVSVLNRLSERENKLQFQEHSTEGFSSSNVVTEETVVHINKKFGFGANKETKDSLSPGNENSSVTQIKRDDVEKREINMSTVIDTVEKSNEDFVADNITVNVSISPTPSFPKASQKIESLTSLSNSFNDGNEKQQNDSVSKEKVCEQLLEQHSEEPAQTLSKEQASTQWKRWQKQCIAWEAGMAKNSSKSHLKRAIRKSSAARKLPPLSEEDILDGKWPNYKNLTSERTLDALSRVYIAGEDNGRGQNLINMHRCANLTHLTLIKCGLVSLEGMQLCPSLRHIDVSHNSISVMSCDGMKRLESLVVGSNRLTSIHGLSGCHSLLLLDLSNNNITKIAGLDDIKNLSHLRLSNNQLMNVTGLRVASSLISLDLSSNTLSNLDGIEGCGLVRCLDASNNCFSKIPAKNLTNLVLLVSLDLSGNNIENLDVASNDENQLLFLPFLAYLKLQRNKISFEDGLGCYPISKYAPLLLQLNLSQNLISNSELLIEFLSPFSNLMRLLLSENLFSTEQEEKILTKCQDQSLEVFFQDEVMMTSPSKTVSAINQVLTLPPSPSARNCSLKEDNDVYMNMTNKQRIEFFELVQTETKEVKGLRGWRKAADNTYKLPPDIFSYHCDYLQKHSELTIQQRLIQEGRHSYIEKSILSETSNSEYAKEEIDFSSNRKSMTCQWRGNVSYSNSKSNDRINNTTLPNQAKYTRKQEHYAAVKIQASWRKYTVRKNHRLRACVRIQAVWRGYVVRRNMRKAFASFNTSSSIDIDDFEEIDLSQLEFDENIYDQQWAIRTNMRPINSPPSSTPTRRAHSAGMARQPHNSPVKNSSPIMDDSLARKGYLEIDNSQNVWQKIASLSKPPLPPITPTGSTVATEHYDVGLVGDGAGSDMDSHRSKYSRKEEVLANEWGLHNSSAVELMLKRAKRMKGRKRKQVNAEEKLRRFQDLKQRVSEKPLATTRKHSQSQHRMEYFKARELEFESRERKAPSEDDERKRQYTYEWLHTSANVSHRGHHSTPRNPARWHHSDDGSMKSGFLPVIPQQRSVVTPLQQNDLEISSLSSHSSQQARSKNLLRDIARRHGDLDFHDQRR